MGFNRYSVERRVIFLVAFIIAMGLAAFFSLIVEDMVDSQFYDPNFLGVYLVVNGTILLTWAHPLIFRQWLYFYPFRALWSIVLPVFGVQLYLIALTRSLVPPWLLLVTFGSTLVPWRTLVIFLCNLLSRVMVLLKRYQEFKAFHPYQLSSLAAAVRKRTLRTLGKDGYYRLINRFNEYVEGSVRTARKIAADTDKVDVFQTAICWLAEHDPYAKSTNFKILEEMEAYIYMPYLVEYLYHSWKSDNFLIHQAFLKQACKNPIKESTHNLT